ncbi:GH25 family lysozyme, partial [Bifidobacterium adolescentis]
MNILNKGKPKHKRMNPRRQWRKLLTALAVAISMAVAPAAMADMNGYDISNWQCGIDTATVPADFVIVGTTWGSGGVYGGCLSNGVNTDANRQLAGAIDSGKETGVYHYARGGNPETEARFFVDNVRGYVHKSVLILDWEAQDNTAWGDKQWPRRWAREVKRLTGVNPIIYTMDSGYWQVAGMETELNCGIWIAQYATNLVTGYQTAPWNIGARGEVMRQYTSNGSLSGWSGRLDLNKFRGDRAAWRKYANPDDKGTASLPNVKPTPQPTTAPTVDLDALATRTIRGDFGNDPARRQALGSNYAAVMAIVNRRLSGSGVTTPYGNTGYCVVVSS